MTGRLPFDPARMRVAPATSRTPGDQAAQPSASAQAGDAAATPITVSALAALIGSALERMERPIRVVGEVSGLRERTHWYFDLKDADAVVNCVMFASAARRSGLTLQNGASVVATGRVEFYAKGGKVSLVCDRIERVGAGALEQALRRLVEEIRALGWLDPARKRRLPTFPRRIAVVTSRTGAALQDVIDTARRRCPAVEIAVLDVRVQGDRAAAEIASAIRWLGAHGARLAIDAVLLTRGGGSMEDLWAFNDRDVAAAIVESPIPVVAAIGHETDTTIAELVADERCATPTQAAMRLIPDRAALSEQADALTARLGSSLDRRIDRESRRADHAARHLLSAARLRAAAARARADGLAARLEQHRPAAAKARREARFRIALQRLADLAGKLRDPAPVRDARRRLAGVMASQLRAARETAASADRTLGAVSPLRVLARGYSVTTTVDGRVVRAPRDAAPGQTITTRLSEGVVRSVVERNSGAGDPGGPAHSGAGEAPSPQGGRRKQGQWLPPPGQHAPGLFDGFQ